MKEFRKYLLIFMSAVLLAACDVKRPTMYEDEEKIEAYDQYLVDENKKINDSSSFYISYYDKTSNLTYSHTKYNNAYLYSLGKNEKKESLFVLFYENTAYMIIDMFEKDTAKYYQTELTDEIKALIQEINDEDIKSYVDHKDKLSIEGLLTNNYDIVKFDTIYEDETINATIYMYLGKDHKVVLSDNGECIINFNYENSHLDGLVRVYSAEKEYEFGQEYLGVTYSKDQFSSVNQTTFIDLYHQQSDLIDQL